jgi:hypothetical protein
MIVDTQQKQFPWAFAGLVTLLLYAGTFLITRDLLQNSLGDTDDALRLVQLRNFLEHGNWYDFKIDRLSPPDGYISHWSRLPDAIMAVLYNSALLFGSAETAIWFVRAFYPGLWVAPAFLALSFLIFRMTELRLMITVLLISLLLCITSMMQFAGGRIDHHNAQISLSVIITVATALIAGGKRYGVIAGLASALLLAIGLEALPFVVLGAALIGVRHVLLNSELATLRAYLLALGGGSLLALIATVPPLRWSETACDALAANYALPIVAGCLVLWLFTGSRSLNESVAKRLGGVVLAGLVAAALFVFLDPSCLHGPFATVDSEAKKIWLTRVNEMQPVVDLGNLKKSIPNMIFGVCILPTSFAALWLLSNPAYRKNYLFWTLLSAFVVSAILGLMALRMATYVGWFAAPVLCLAAVELTKRHGRKSLYIFVPAVIAFLPVAFPFWLQPALSAALLEKSEPKESTSKATCTDTKNYADLAKLPKGHVMAEVDLGPYVLALTPHSVVAAPYHRIGGSIVQSIKFFDGLSLQDAQDVARKMNIVYVVLCDKETKTGLTVAGGNLRALVFQGKQPDWLQPVSTSPDNLLKIFTVKLP